MTLFIYGLKNPLYDKYFYIGITSLSLQRRLRQHLSDKNDQHPKVMTIKAIRCMGSEPNIELIEELTDLPSGYFSDEKEKYWIDYYMQLGHPLTNLNHVNPVQYTKSSKRGGKRANAGRKPSTEEKKEPLTFYFTQETILKFGSKSRMKDLMYKLVEEYDSNKNG